MFVLVNHLDQALGCQNSLLVLFVVCREAKTHPEIHGNEGKIDFLKVRRAFLLLLCFAAHIAAQNLLPVLFFIPFVAVKIVQ